MGPAFRISVLGKTFGYKRKRFYDHVAKQEQETPGAVVTASTNLYNK